MTELDRIDKVINELYDIRDVALSVFGNEGYFALDDSIRTLTKTWSICKRGQEEKLKNAYHTPVNNSKKPIKSAHNGEDECGMCEAESDILVEDLKESLGHEGYNMDIVNEFFDDKELDDYDSLCYDCEGKLRKEFEKYSTNRSAAFSSRKPIKSDYHNKEIYREAFASLVKDSNAQDFDNGDYGIAHYPGFYRVLVDGNYETEFSAETDEEAIQKFKNYFANKKKGINNSKKPIKSTVNNDAYDEYYDDGIWDDNNWKEELRRRYNENSTEWPSEEYNYCKDMFLDDFSKEYNIPREQVDIEMRLMEGQWLEDADKAGIVDEYSVYSSKTRNQSSLNKIFS